MTRLRTVSLMVGLPLLGLAAASVVHVPAGTIAIVTARGGGTPTLLEPGFALRIPGVQSVHLFRDGQLSVKGAAEVASREGSSLSIPFELGARPGPQRLLELEREGEAAGAPEAARRQIGALLKRSAAAIGTYDLASGGALDSLARGASKALEDRLGPGVTLTLHPPVLPAELEAAFAKEAIFGKRRNTGTWVLLVGLDGADWDFIDPMIAGGELPNLARLKKRGAWGRLRSNVPTLSPLLWTTVATGKAPDRHGINDFLVLDQGTGRQVPIDSTFRKTLALWNILSLAKIRNDFVAWWATWPAEPVDGHLISDRVAYSTFNLGAPEETRGLVYPPEYAAAVARLKVSVTDITTETVGRFARLDSEELRVARSAPPAPGPSEERRLSINVLLRVLASTATYQRIAIDLLEGRARDSSPAGLVAVYFQGIDEVNHRFAHCEPPRATLCSEADFRRFSDTVRAFYRYQDRLLGEMLARAPGATVIVMSDHGFASGAGRPKEIKPFIEGKPGLWHDLGGIFLAAGPSIKAGELPPVTLYDIAPTILYLLGLPTAEDMPGRVIEEALTRDFQERYPAQRVPSYEPLPHDRKPDTERSEVRGEPDSGETEMLEQLRALGYVGPGASPEKSRNDGRPESGGVVPTVLYHTNLATVYLGKKQYEQAEAEYQIALRLDPEAPQPLLGLAALYEAKGEPEKALEFLESLESRSILGEGGPLVKMAELFIRIGRPADGVVFMKKLEPRRARGGSPEVSLRIALGMLEAASGRAADAERSLAAALRLDPSSVAAMQEMFALYDGQGRARELEPRLRDVLRSNPRSAMHHNWLGLALRRRGDLQGAEAELRKALEMAPGLVGAMANLGSLYLQEGKPREAVAILREALQKDAQSVESRTNLIVALGMTHDIDAARDEVSQAEKEGRKVPLYYNALAYAYHVNGRDEEALAALRESLRLDPKQSDALRLRAEIERGQPAAGSPYR